ncbi:MAG: hypothetical protein AB1696_07105 [Planctomycetota bacterium]
MQTFMYWWTVACVLSFILCVCDEGTCQTETISPLTQLKKHYPDTDLVRDGAARAAIYHPSLPDYETAAKELSQKFRERFGFELPVRPDDANRAWRKETGHVIAMGNVGNSLLIRWLYLREFFAPSSNRQIRTVHDPWGEGRNAVLLAGVDLSDVKANFTPLLDRLQRPQPNTLILPQTLDPAPAVGDDIKAQIDEHRRDLPKMPLNYPAYHAGWVCKHYPRLGFDGFIPLYRESLQRLVQTKSYCHLYLFRESRGWDVIEEAPSLTDEDRLMITNFFRNSVASEKEGIGSLRKLLKGKRLIQGNHQSQTACGIMVVADYLRRYYPSELHEQWYKDALAFFEPYRAKGCYLGDDEGMQAASIDNIMNAVYLTDDDPASHPFLQRTLDRLMPNYNNFGMWPSFGDNYASYRFGAGFYMNGAQIYGKPEYLWMYHFITNASPTAAPKIPTEKPKAGWWPIDFAPRQPEGFVGLQWSEPDETLFSLAKSKWAEENKVSVSDCFGRAAFRAGINPQDDYLLLDGVHLGHAYDDQNGILEYSTLGRTFLVSRDYNYGSALSAHNVVAVSVNGMADIDPCPLATRRLWANLPSFAATRTVLYTDGHSSAHHVDSPSADWERNILWLKNQFFIVFDRVVARQEGMHSAVGFWRMVGDRHDLPDGMEMRQQAGDQEVRFRLAVQGADYVAIGKDEDPQATYAFGRYGKQPPPMDNVPPVVHMLKAHKARQLKPGESFTMATCFWAGSAQRPNEITCRAVSSDAVRIEVNGEAMLAARGDVSLPGLMAQAEMSLIARQRVCMVAGRKLSLGERVAFEAQTPISFEWDLASGQCHVEAKQATKASWNGQMFDIPAGRSIHAVKEDGIAEALAAALKSMPALPSTQTTHLPKAEGRLKVVGARQGASGVECLWAGKLGPDGDHVIVGYRDGGVEALKGIALDPSWTYRCAGVVNSIDAGDLNGDGVFEVAVGSDDHHLHALTHGGKALWKWKPPFDELKARIAYCHWLWPEPFVKKVAVHNINKDGKAEIVTGTGMNTFAVDGAGKQLWAFRDSKGHTPCMRAIVFADVDNDGVEEPIGGASDMWYDPSMYAIGPKGEQKTAFASDGWCSGVKAAIAEDIAGKGRKGLAYVTRKGGLWCYPDVTDTKTKWYRRFADLKDRVATLAHKGGAKLIIVAGGDDNWVTALDATGNRVWAVYFDAAIGALASNAAKDKLYVGCDDGAVHELDAAGRLLRSTTIEGAPNLAVPFGAGIALATEEGSVYLIEGES